MTLSPAMIAELQKFASATAIEPFYLFSNPASPMTRALEKDGLIEGNTTFVNPANNAQIAYKISATGIAALPPVAAATGTAWAGSVGDVNPNTGLTETGDAPVTQHAPRKRGATAGVKRGPRQEIIAHKAIARFATLPVGIKTAGVGSGNHESYPFSKLAAPDETGFDSFFLPSQEDAGKHFKTVNSAVLSANKRHKLAGKPHTFTARAIENDPQFNANGIRVFRVDGVPV